MEITENTGQATAGGEIGWDEFVDRYARPLHAAVRRALARVDRRAGRELVEDLVQEVWCRLLEQGVRPHRFRGRAHREVAGYLGRVAASVVVDRTRAACAVKRGGEHQPLRIEGGTGDRQPLDRAGADHTPYASISRGIAGTRGSTLIVNLPGSTSGVRDGLGVLDDIIDHAVQLLRGTDTESHHPPNA
jgi:DNA-directed RNA polymerase specialized sigma24 family protein